MHRLRLGFCWDQHCLGDLDRFRHPMAICASEMFLTRESVIGKTRKNVVYYQKIEKSPEEEHVVEYLRCFRERNW